jgi:hypothetical protein
MYTNLLKLVAQLSPHIGRSSQWYQVGLALVVGGGLGLLIAISPMAAFGLLLAGGIAMAAVLQPISLAHLIIIVTVLTSGMERGRIVPLLRLNELALVASIGLLIIVLLANRDRQLEFRPLVIGLFAFAFLFLGTTFLPIVIYAARGTQFGVSNVLVLASTLQYVLLFIIFTVLPKDNSERLGLLVTMLVSATIVAGVGLLQAVQFGPVVSLIHQWYPSNHEADALAANRVTSLIGAWNALGMLLMTSLLIGWVSLNHGKRPAMRLLIIACMTLCAGCLIASGSFAGSLTLLVGLFLIEVLAGRASKLGSKLLWIITIFTPILLVLWPVISPLLEARMSYQYDRQGWTSGILPATLTYRFWVWTDVFWPQIRQNWLWGSYLDVPHWLDWQYEESQYVMLLFRYGAVGLAFFSIWLTIMLLWLYHQVSRRDGLAKDIAVTAFTFLILMSIAGLTNAVMSYSGAADYMWILFGLVASSSDKENSI